MHAVGRSPPRLWTRSAERVPAEASCGSCLLMRGSHSPGVRRGMRGSPSGRSRAPAIAVWSPASTSLLPCRATPRPLRSPRSTTPRPGPRSWLPGSTPSFLTTQLLGCMGQSSRMCRCCTPASLRAGAGRGIERSWSTSRDVSRSSFMVCPSPHPRTCSWTSRHIFHSSISWFSGIHSSGEVGQRASGLWRQWRRRRAVASIRPDGLPPWSDVALTLPWRLAVGCFES